MINASMRLSAVRALPARHTRWLEKLALDGSGRRLLSDGNWVWMPSSGALEPSANVNGPSSGSGLLITAG